MKKNILVGSIFFLVSGLSLWFFVSMMLTFPNGGVGPAFLATVLAIPIALFPGWLLAKIK